MNHKIIEPLKGALKDILLRFVLNVGMLLYLTISSMIFVGKELILVPKNSLTVFLIQHHSYFSCWIVFHSILFMYIPFKSEPIYFSVAVLFSLGIFIF